MNVHSCCQLSTCSRMIMICGKIPSFVCVSCVCPTLGINLLAIATMRALMFFKGVITLSFAVLIELYKAHWNSKKG